MGNKNDKEISEDERKELSNINKDKILRGSFKDRFKVENKDPLDFYDMIIDIDSFSQKPEIIWKIQTKSKAKLIEQKPEKEEKEEEEEEEVNDKENINQKIEPKLKEKPDKIEDITNINEDNLIIIGVIGLGNVGKSYLLSLFTGEELPTGDSIHTKGISIKRKKKLIILDSEGVEAPLTKSNISQDIYPKENLLNKEINESDRLIQTIAKDKKAVELFIQDFIIEKSSILFIVVGQLTLTEQKLINRVVNQTDKKYIFVIHNLKNLYTKDQIDGYIKNIFKKNIFLNFETFSEQIYKDDKNIIEEFNKYYIESYNKISDNSKKKVIHLIMASNVKESEAYYYNKTAVDYVRTEMSIINEGQKFNLIEELKQFILKKGEKYAESEEDYKPPFSEEDIQIEKEGDNKYIKIKNKSILKKCLINKLGFSSFYGALYSPNYVCYFDQSKNENEKLFVVEINLCGKNYKVNNPKREEIVDQGHKTIISITGSKQLKEYKNVETLEGSTMDSGNFRIDIVLDNDKYKFKPGIQVKKEKKKGILRFIYTLLNDNNSKENCEMKGLDFSKKEKPLDKKNNNN